ncbi:MAG: DNA polymerase/3'-5' exonuclease PolX [Pseudomonadota bacterium]
MDKNREIAAIFSRIADALELRGDEAFKIMAYRRAAGTLGELDRDIEELMLADPPAKIPGIGDALAEKINEYLETGRVKKLEQALEGIPPGLFELLEIKGLGMKTARLAWRELGVEGLEDMKRACEDGSLAKLPGLGKKKAKNILEAVRVRERISGRIPLLEGLGLTTGLAGHLYSAPGVLNIAVAGSLRRMMETSANLNLLASGPDPKKIVDHFCSYKGARGVIEAAENHASIEVQSGAVTRSVDLIVAGPGEFGSALQYYTGSKEHNEKLGRFAEKKGLTMTVRGVFRGNEKIAGADEEEVYEALGLSWIPPELREDSGEIEAAAAGSLPVLIENKDIRGDLHVHSSFSDGLHTIAQLVKRVRALGYGYIAICDHSQSVKYAGGLEPDRLKMQWDEIDRLNEKYKDLTILKGTEVDILPDGGLDYPDSILEKLDVVVASIHQGFRKNVTERIVAAIEHPLVRIIGHPTGRLISGRPGYEVDIDRVMDAAAANRKILELNAFHDRLDLSDANLRKAREKGIKISIGTDAHATDGLGFMALGVATARRAWLEKKDVINSLPIGEMKKILCG